MATRLREATIRTRTDTLRAALVVALLATACRPTTVPDAPPDSGRHDRRGSGRAVAETPHPPTVAPAAPQPPLDVVRLIVMGDSISAGAGASRPPGLAYGGLLAANDDARWPNAVGLDLATRFAHPVPVINVAVPGATAESMVAEQPARLRQRLSWPVRGHSVVVMTIGGNDVAESIATGDPAGAPLAHVLVALRATAALFGDRASFPDGVSMYVATVFDPTDGEGFAAGCFYDLHLANFVAALDLWRTRYADLGRELGFGVVDALGRFHGHGHHYRHVGNLYYDRNDASGWFSDCIHPNDAAIMSCVGSSSRPSQVHPCRPERTFEARSVLSGGLMDSPRTTENVGTDASATLLARLFIELFQTEESAFQHPGIEAERLGDVGPARAMRAVSEHAGRSLETLRALAPEEKLETSSVGARVGDLFSALRDLVADRTLDREKTYRGTLLGMERVNDRAARRLPVDAGRRLQRRHRP